MTPEDLWPAFAASGVLALGAFAGSFVGCRRIRRRTLSATTESTVFWSILVFACGVGLGFLFTLAATIGLALQPTRREANYTTLAQQSGEFWPCCDSSSNCTPRYCFVPSVTLAVLEQNTVSNVTLFLDCGFLENCVDNFFAHFPPINGTRRGFYVPDMPTNISFLFVPLGLALVAATIALAGLAVGSVLGILVEHASRKNSGGPAGGAGATSGASSVSGVNPNDP